MQSVLKFIYEWEVYFEYRQIQAFVIGWVVMGIVCVVVGHSVDAYRWLRRKIKYIMEVHNG